MHPISLKITNDRGLLGQLWKKADKYSIITIDFNIIILSALKQESTGLEIAMYDQSPGDLKETLRIGSMF